MRGAPHQPDGRRGGDQCCLRQPAVRKRHHHGGDDDNNYDDVIVGDIHSKCRDDDFEDGASRRVVLLKSRAKIRSITIFLVESSKSASSAERGALMYVFHFRLRRRWAREETAVSATGKREDPDDSKLHMKGGVTRCISGQPTEPPCVACSVHIQKQGLKNISSSE